MNTNTITKILIGIGFASSLTACPGIGTLGGGTPSPYTPSNPPPGTVLFSEDFANGQKPSTIYVQALPNAFSIVPAPGGRSGYATRCSNRQTDNFGGVGGGGVPRCEGIPEGKSGSIKLEFGRTYMVRTSYYLPPDYQIDLKQPELSFQIHQDFGDGRPPIQQDFQEGKVVWEVKWSQKRGYHGETYDPPKDAPGATDKYTVANISDIKGKWVDLEITYKPASDNSGVLIVKMNGQTVIDRQNQPNNYNVQGMASAGYIKMFGWYKWFWKSQASDASERTVYYGPTQISVQ